MIMTTNNDDEGKIIYLTGSTGYLGSVILRKLVIDNGQDNKQTKNNSNDGNNDNGNQIDKNTISSNCNKISCKSVYLPIRDKKGKTGQERFHELNINNNNNNKTQWIDPSDPIPNDTQIVILNAFDVNFYREITDIVQSSVTPTIQLLKQCEKLPNLQKVMFVSTAYVQPPLPCRRIDDAIPFGGSNDPMSMYHDIIDGKVTWQDLKNDKQNHPHTTLNTYIYAKTLMENIIFSCFSTTLPIVCVRPSIIGPSSDGTRGSKYSPGCRLALMVSAAFGGNCPICEGHGDCVLVDKVADQVLLPATRTTFDNERIIWATSGKPVSMYETTKALNPAKPLIVNLNLTMQVMVQKCEVLAVQLLSGRKNALLVEKFYRDSNYISTFTFDFPQAVEQDTDAFFNAAIKWSRMFMQKLENKKNLK